MTVKNINEAWAKVDEIFPTDYSEDVSASERAGYKIYRSSINHYDYICDLGDRLEINLSNGKTINVWIEKDETDTIIENGQIIYEFGKCRVNINMSRIWDALIKESARCDSFCSDLLIAYESVTVRLKDSDYIENTSEAKYYFGFRDMGIDPLDFIIVKGWDNKEYRKIMCLTIKTDIIKHRILAELETIKSR